jgi:hypothetical protein
LGCVVLNVSKAMMGICISWFLGHVIFGKRFNILMHAVGNILQVLAKLAAELE